MGNWGLEIDELEWSDGGINGEEGCSERIGFDGGKGSKDGCVDVDNKGDEEKGEAFSNCCNFTIISAMTVCWVAKELRMTSKDSECC